MWLEKGSQLNRVLLAPGFIHFPTDKGGPIEHSNNFGTFPRRQKDQEDTFLGNRSIFHVFDIFLIFQDSPTSADWFSMTTLLCLLFGTDCFCLLTFHIHRLIETFSCVATWQNQVMNTTMKSFTIGILQIILLIMYKLIITKKLYMYIGTVHLHLETKSTSKPCNAPPPYKAKKKEEDSIQKYVWPYKYMP